jgi:epoxyqueuosine reductase QueG
MLNRIIETLQKHLAPGRYIYGFGDLTGLLDPVYSHVTHGISIICRLDDDIIDGIGNGPTLEYYTLYTKVNLDLNAIVANIARDLTSELYTFLPVYATIEDPSIQETFAKTLTYNFSHKMVATRSGLGWVGKTDLLISRQFGPRIRMASVVTNYPLPCNEVPINESRCGTCRICVDTCPAKAANGIPWDIHTPRDVFFDPFKCRKYCREISKRSLSLDISLCGKCVMVCPMGKQL